jgi:glycosyltransferase involved in cell wall biosynthesis
MFHLVGGLPEDVRRTREQLRDRGLRNVIVHGYQPPANVPPFLWHADVLLLPPSGNHPSARWTSPVKLGEYLASGVPVVSTRIPALRDWLTEDETRFVEPDDPAALAAGILDVLQDETLAESLSATGLRLAHTLAYKRRAEQILCHPQVAYRLARSWPRNVLSFLWPSGGIHHV